LCTPSAEIWRRRLNTENPNSIGERSGLRRCSCLQWTGWLTFYRDREREREERMRERERERVPLWVLPNKSPVSGKKYQNASCSFNQSLYPRSIVLIDIIHYYDGIRFSSNLISHDLTFHQTLLNVLHTPICIHSFIDEFTCS
jgi:hypothetical protein